MTMNLNSVAFDLRLFLTGVLALLVCSGLTQIASKDRLGPYGIVVGVLILASLIAALLALFALIWAV